MSLLIWKLFRILRAHENDGEDEAPGDETRACANTIVEPSVTMKEIVEHNGMQDSSCR